MRLSVDKAKCQGHAMCNMVSAELFPIDDDGYIAVETVAVPAGADADARRGVDTCPERAITVVASS
ncbi:ferredoxin [Mycobacterium sherrisii]|uniref:Ferredoxin n=1 Tax=Mycobacterium sherrisii TaxID=243061 RepID=A0A1E3SP05_9MYCO|nr:ferredoxin [Mycobacterium sherrisii]MCV7032337.1 ferredoxin [Mycobacterium sherrisii]ODR03870.1 ferredoxin [Mycobacterium sherrisii]ORW74585.1 ferredoxin [Mycobacterium sherrisii]